MISLRRFLLIPGLWLFFSCQGWTAGTDHAAAADSLPPVQPIGDSLLVPENIGPPPQILKPEPLPVTDTLKPEAGVNALVKYAKTLVGTPYCYGSADIKKGFDCSGFISHVFQHFKIEVPRSSVDFTYRGQTIPLSDVLPGDLILFTGTDPAIRVVGHMGIVVEPQPLRFIHSSSGKAKGVVISDLSEHYKKRFVKVIRL